MARFRGIRKKQNLIYHFGELAPGVYFLTFETGNKMIAKKFIKTWAVVIIAG